MLDWIDLLNTFFSFFFSFSSKTDLHNYDTSKVNQINTCPPPIKYYRFFLEWDFGVSLMEYF